MVVLINILIIVLGFLRPLRTLGHALFDFLGQLDDVNGNIFRGLESRNVVNGDDALGCIYGSHLCLL